MEFCPFHGILAIFKKFSVCAREGVELWASGYVRRKGIEIWIPGILLAGLRQILHYRIKIWAVNIC